MLLYFFLIAKDEFKETSLMKDEWRDGAISVTFIRTHFLNPGEWVRLHQRVWDADHVHPVHDTLQRDERSGLGTSPARKGTESIRALLTGQLSPETPFTPTRLSIIHQL